MTMTQVGSIYLPEGGDRYVDTEVYGDVYEEPIGFIRTLWKNGRVVSLWQPNPPEQPMRHDVLAAQIVNHLKNSPVGVEIYFAVNHEN